MNTTNSISRDATAQRLTLYTARLLKLVPLAAALLPLLFLTTQAGAQSALDGFDPNANGLVRAVVVQPDGKIILGGEFTTLAPNGGATVIRNHIARLNPDGTLDTAFNPNADGTVSKIALQADGKILVAGGFMSIGGQMRRFIARLDPATGLADSFNPNTTNGVGSIAVQADGKILAGGTFTTPAPGGGTITRNNLARLNPDGTLDTAFDPNPNGNFYAIALQADGKILVGGDFTSIGGQTRNSIARLDAATGLADSFNPNASPTVHSIVVQADGKILVGGSFSGNNSIGGQTRNCIARLDPTTGLADSFDPNASAQTFSPLSVYGIALQTDGKILACGSFTRIGGQVRNYIARLDTTTGLADSFNSNAGAPSASGFVRTVVVQADGKVLAGGGFTAIGGQPRNYIARLEADGRLDETFNRGTIDYDVTATAVQPDGKILIGGWFTSVYGVARNKIARLNTDGTLDPIFDPNASGSGPGVLAVDAIAVQADGKILVAGTFTGIGGQPRNRIARLDPTTGQADSFNPDADARVMSLLVQADGKILVCGDFTRVGGQTRHYIARLDPTTGLADSFDPNANTEVRTLAVQPDGKILAGGAFNSIGGQPRARLARLDPVTGLADSFNPDPGGDVFAILLQPDGKVLVGGSIMKRYRPDGTRDTVFNTGFSGGATPIFTLGLQADGKILVGGIFYFAQFGGQQRNFFARLDAVTGVADSFQPNRAGHAIALLADGKILVDGVRITNDIAAGQDLAVTKSAVTWTLSGSSPQLARVTFEYSTDNVNYTALGNGTVSGSSWTLTGLTMPIEQNFYVRARGHYRTGCFDGSESIRESVRNAFILRPSTFGNISTRLRVQTGDSAMIGGFIITGTQPKTVIVRGIGPSLPIPGAMADPVIEVYGASGQLLATNDNWNDSLTRQQIIDSGLAPSNDLESALWGIIDPGAYTVVVRGNNNSTGIGLFEVYDLDQAVDAKLANISTRGFIETGDNVMIGGTIIVGNNPTRVLLRAIGPSLVNFGVPNALPDPTLELYDGNGGLVAANNNWRSDQEAEIIATGLSPSNNQESAIVRDLFPGNYTAIVRGSNNVTGVALIEAYGVD